METAPPRGRPEFNPDHISIHHLRLNHNAESTKSPDQMWSPTGSDHRKPLEGREGRTAGEKERSRERMRFRSDLCWQCGEVVGKRIWRLAGGRRDSVAWSLWLEDRPFDDGEETVSWRVGLRSFSFFFIFFFFSPSGCAVIWGRPANGRTWFGQWDFFFHFFFGTWGTS
jgi:hypothetical protein